MRERERERERGGEKEKNRDRRETYRQNKKVREGKMKTEKRLNIYLPLNELLLHRK